MLIKQNEVDEHKLCGICETLGVEELLGQLTEECGELVQAAQKLRRVFKGTTHVTLEDALVRLAEECADVALCIDTLTTVHLVNGGRIAEHRTVQDKPMAWTGLRGR